MNDPEMLYGTTLSVESIKVMAESIGVGALPDDAAKELADDVSFKLKQIVQDAAKFMHHAKRRRLSLQDVDQSLKVRNVEPQYGFVAKDFIPFRFASGGGRELHFIEEKELDLSEVIQSAPPKLPLDVTIRAHWLCVDGIQPTVPENPPPLSKDAQAQESVNPIKKLDQTMTKDTAGKPTTGKVHKLKNVETVHVKQLATHELSVEQQLYYKEITEACVGSDEARRAEALQSVACDPGLHEMLPRMCTFIAEGVKVNVVQNNLALLIYLMRMVRALLDNSALYLEKYLHELIPSVSTCIVSRQLCMRPELDNHWALRDFAARLMAQICKNFNTSTNNLQTRVTRLFSTALQNERTHLSSLYGAVAGLSELGTEVIKVIIVPRLKFISDRIEPHLQGPAISNTDKIAAGHIRAMLQKNCAPILKTIRNPPDYNEDYKRDYGFLGPTLHQAVVKARNAPPAPVTTTQNSSTTSTGTVSLVSTPISTATSTIARQQTPHLTGRIGNIQTPAIGQAIQRQTSQTQIIGQSPATSQQKFVFVPRPTTPNDLYGNISSTGQLSNTGMNKFSNNQPSNVQIVNSPQPIQVQKLPTTQKVVMINVPPNQSQVHQASLNQQNSVSIVTKAGVVPMDTEDIPEIDDLSHLE